MAEKKVTKRDNFNKLLELVKGDMALTEFINHEIELLDKKANRTSKENEGHIALMDTILEVMQMVGNPVTITELQKSDERLSPKYCSNQKISAMLTKLIAKNLVERDEVKRQAYFKLV